MTICVAQWSHCRLMGSKAAYLTTSLTAYHKSPSDNSVKQLNQRLDYTACGACVVAAHKLSNYKPMLQFRVWS